MFTTTATTCTPIQKKSVWFGSVRGKFLSSTNYGTACVAMKATQDPYRALHAHNKDQGSQDNHHVHFSRSLL